MNLNFSKSTWLVKPAWFSIFGEFKQILKIAPAIIKSLFILQAVIFILSILSIFEVGFATSMTLTEAVTADKLGFFEGFIHGYFIVVGWGSSFFFDTTVYALNSTPAYGSGFGLGMLSLIMLNTLNKAIERYNS